MDFVSGLPLKLTKKDSVWVIVDRPTKLAHFLPVCIDYSLHRDIEFSVGEQVFLKVSPWNKVLRFGHNGKLNPRFIGPYRVLKRVGPVACQLELPMELDRIHDVFHVSMLRRYHFDPSYIIQINEFEVRLNLTYEKEPIHILDCELERLRKKQIPLVKVLWRNHGVNEAIWELEESMRHRCLHLFRLGKF
ncbi:uncharacterized protein [Gossypium hirsutum]|uniref:Tf2-1-like SH3-like domain-containing protein n=1 Tax=Gossypium hirsutum TaxID=3635 RepID=A0A1U8NMN5_GOSHI|nr:uncharacterized protein LOC107949886 [Gossypium hirsutum]